MNYCQELVNRYLAFYLPKPKKGKGYTATGCVKPFSIAIKILIQNTQTSNEEIELMISASLAKLMSQIHGGTAEGIWVTRDNAEIEAIKEFSRFFIQDFWAGLNHDRARISGNKAALYEHTCEFLVRQEMDRRKKEKNA